MSGGRLRPGRLVGKVALVTGAGSGIGAACAELFAEEGGRVVLVGRTPGKLAGVVERIVAAGGEAIAVTEDLTDELAAERCMDAAVARFGRIDVLVHAAGVGYSWEETSPNSMQPIHNTPADKWREVIGLNLEACFLVCKAAVLRMLEQGGGSIVTVGSVGGILGLADSHAYATAKAGAIHLTRSLCVAYAKDNIRANCVAPGAVDTPMIAPIIGAFDDPATAAIVSPARRPADPREIAYACLFLASDEASYCNGAVLVADGGTSARLTEL